MKLLKLKRPIALYNIDGTINEDGFIREIIYLKMTINGHTEVATFAVTQTHDDVVLGIDWLKLHNPAIDWSSKTMSFSRCPDHCQKIQKIAEPVEIPVRTSRPKREKTTQSTKPFVEILPEDETDVPDTSRTYNYEKDEDLFAMWANGPTKLPSDTPKLFLCAGYTYAQQAAEAKQSANLEKSFEELVLEQYRDFADVFSKKQSERLPERRTYNHGIKLIPGYSNFRSKVYPLSETKQKELDKFLEENLRKGYIRPSSSPLSSGFFFVRKKDSTLHPV